MSMWRRLLQQLFKSYQVSVMEPEGRKNVRHIRVNLATVLAIVLFLSIGPVALLCYLGPPQNSDLSARYYQMKQQNHDLRNQLATRDGELALADEQIDGLKNELSSSQQRGEDIRQSLNIYESILEARKSSGVRVLRASAQMEDASSATGRSKLSYSIVLVKGGNYPRSVSGSVRVVALGKDNQQLLLKLGKKTDELRYHMDTHAFLDGSVTWSQDWRPVKLQITRLNSEGSERDQMDIDIDSNKSQ